MEEELLDPRIQYPTDAVVRVTAACLCGSNPPEDVAQGYAAMDAREAVKVLLTSGGAR